MDEILKNIETAIAEAVIDYADDKKNVEDSTFEAYRKGFISGMNYLSIQIVGSRLFQKLMQNEKD